MDNSKRGRQERIDNKLLNENKELKQENERLNNIINELEGRLSILYDLIKGSIDNL